MTADRYPILLLWVIALIFAGFGVVFVFAPEFAADLVTGGKPRVPSAITDMRATYGGVALGMGIFSAIAARRRSWLRPALVAAFVVTVCIGSARALGIVLDGQPNAWMLLFLALEVTFTFLIWLRCAPQQKTLERDVGGDCCRTTAGATVSDHA